MIQKISFEEDLELKRYASTPKDKKPRFDWAAVIGKEHFQRSEIKIEVEGGERDFDLAEIADTIGAALTDLLLSRHEEEIYTDVNQKFVASIAESVGKVLATSIEQGRALKLSAHDIHLLIEKALIENDAHDVAKSLVFGRAKGQERERDPVSIRLIRRNGQVVPWNEAKIEVAVRKSFLSLHLDSTPAVEVARAATDRLNVAGQAFLNIEDVQDAVQEEMMRQGHFKVAEAYILYRAHRLRVREDEGEVDSSEALQESMIVVTEANGENTFWDGLDLKRRIEFAMIGLDLNLSAEAIDDELRRSLYPEMTRSDLQKTIILNAKSMIERDADFSLFAGRVLLTYIYEEVLDWDILRDGVEQLKEAHRRGFKSYLKRAIEIERIHPKFSTSTSIRSVLHSTHRLTSIRLSRRANFI